MHPNLPRNVAVFIGDVFHALHRGLINRDVAGAYASGLMLGSALALAVTQQLPVRLLAYVLPDDEDALQKEQPADEVARALQEHTTPET